MFAFRIGTVKNSGSLRRGHSQYQRLTQDSPVQGIVLSIDLTGPEEVNGVPQSLDDLEPKAFVKMDARFEIPARDADMLKIINHSSATES